MEFNLHEECIIPDLSQNLGDFPGTIVLFDEFNQLSLRKAKSEQDILLGKIDMLYSVLSNGQELAYIDTDLARLMVVSSSGEEITTVNAAENWVEILAWIGHEKVLIGNMPLLPNGGWNPPSSTLNLDLSTGQYQELFPNYPKIYTGPPLPNFGRFSYSITAYDPILTRVVYGTTWGKSAIVLWDLVNERELIRLYARHIWNTPEWKADGTEFIISLPPQMKDSNGDIHRIVNDHSDYIGGSDFFTVSRDGEIKRLTFLTTKINAQEREYTWSPDQKQVGFWFNTTGEDTQWRMAVLNVVTGQILDYCVYGKDGSFPMYWSSDGRYLISTYGAPDYSSTNNTRIILLDLITKTAKLVNSKDIVVGWMDNNP